MYPEDLDAIVGKVNAHAGPERLPFFFFEVTGAGGEAVNAPDYLMVGQSSGQAVSVTDFKYASLFDQFANAPQIASLKSLVSTPSYLPSSQAVVFTTNHDTERSFPPSAVMYQDGKAYDLATVFLLAFPYGYPSLMSSFAFDRTTPAGLAKGPPSDSMGNTTSIYAPGGTTPNCAPDPANAPIGTWVCQHREPFVARMLAFRKALAQQESVVDFWDDGDNPLAFGRGGPGSAGFVAINRSATALKQTLETPLPVGSYCDVFTGEKKGSACTGVTVTVDAGGMASLDVPPMAAAVIYGGSRL
jgi:alpha-amylase